MKQLTIKTAFVDTVVILIVIFCGSYFGNAMPIRLITVACLIMALIEVIVSNHYADNGKANQKVGFNVAMTIILLSAICLLLNYQLDWRYYIICLGMALACDACGLFFGRMFGGNHTPWFCRRLSPNKTYAGYLGELLIALLTGSLGMWLLGIPPYWTNILFVLTGWIACAAGDLVGSGTKRELGIKHSSDYLIDLPILGKIEVLMRSRHGFLDCMDSASFAIIYFILLQQLGRL